MGDVVAQDVAAHPVEPAVADLGPGSDHVGQGRDGGEDLQRPAVHPLGLETVGCAAVDTPGVGSGHAGQRERVEDEQVLCVEHLPEAQPVREQHRHTDRGDRRAEAIAKTRCRCDARRDGHEQEQCEDRSRQGVVEPPDAAESVEGPRRCVDVDHGGGADRQVERGPAEHDDPHGCESFRRGTPAQRDHDGTSHEARTARSSGVRSPSYHRRASIWSERISMAVTELGPSSATRSAISRHSSSERPFRTA